MLNSKQRKYLKGLASKETVILHIGKDGLGETLARQADTALTARELIKGRVLETAPLSVKEAAQALSEQLNADIVQTIGFCFVLYRPNPEKPILTLP